MLKQKIEEILKKAAVVEGAEIFAQEKPEFGHYSTNAAMKLAKEKGKSPMDVAKEMITSINRSAPKDFFEKIESAAPGFINFWISESAIQKEFSEICKKGEKWGRPAKKTGKTAVIDYSGINIAKPMHVGHLRSTIIGQALYNIFNFSGWKTIGDNHLGDWGKQFGVLIAAFKESQASNKKLKIVSIEDLMKLYVDYTARMKTEKALEDAAKNETKKLQNGDKENLTIWKKFYRITFSELDEVFKLLGIKFDYQLGESFYNSMLAGVVKDALQKGVAKVSDGAVVIFTDNDKSPLLIQKSDEAYLYGTTDIAAIKYRIQKFKPELILYVVDNGQSLHFEQVFKAVKMLGYAKSEKLAHVKFGLMLAEDMKKLSTRKGSHISLLDLINEAIVKSEKIIEEKNPGLSKKEKTNIAKIIGVGALKYNDLSQNRQSDIAFKWEKVLNLEGNSGPYLQYAYVRLKSILAKAKISNSKALKIGPKQFAALKEKEELNLILLLERFPEAVFEITQTYYPHHLADYLYKLAKEANFYYHSAPVLKAEKNVREARLALIAAVAQTLKTGLGLLGIDVPEKM